MGENTFLLEINILFVFSLTSCQHLCILSMRLKAAAVNVEEIKIFLANSIGRIQLIWEETICSVFSVLILIATLVLMLFFLLVCFLIVIDFKSAKLIQRKKYISGVILNVVVFFFGCIIIYTPKENDQNYFELPYNSVPYENKFISISSQSAKVKIL